MTRTTREVEAEGASYRAVEAWRSGTGHTLCYLLRLEGPGGEPAPDDRLDRRIALEPGESLAELEGEAIGDRVSEAAPLTGTERRFRAPDGRFWLAQNVGPVWSEGGVAQGLTEILFTSLEGELERVSLPGAHVGTMEEEELLQRWTEGLRSEPASDRGSAGT